MPDFSVILQQPQVRALVQDNLLERAMHDALFPTLLFRSEAQPVEWPGNVGDTQLFTAPGLLPKKAGALRPGVDPEPQTYPSEQWSSTLQQYGSSIDTHMPTSIVAIVDMFKRNAQQLGLQAGQSINAKVRDSMYNAAMSGWTVVDGVFSGVATVRVKRLNGLTRARNPNSLGTNSVRFEPVSASNTLSVTIFDNGAAATKLIQAFTPDTAGDETGPGTVTFTTTVTNVADRAYIYSFDASSIVRVGGGFKIDDISAGDIPTLADIRYAVSLLRGKNVPPHGDGRFYTHLDTVSEQRLFSDPDMQRLNTSIPDYYMYKDYSIGELLGCVFIRNTECPISTTVEGGLTATYNVDDPFGGELYNNGLTSGVEVHRILFTSQGGIMEYYSDPNAMITEAGINGKVGDANVVNNGIEVNTDRIQLVFRAPQNRMQDKVSTTWKIIADWPARTDAAAGDKTRFKRFITIEHA